MLPGLRWSADGWALVEDQLATAGLATGALFTTSSGHLGLPGPDREPFGAGRTLVVGCFEARPSVLEESGFGLPTHHQTLVSVADPFQVAVRVDGMALGLDAGTWLDHERRLDLHTGCVTTRGTWQTPTGATWMVRSRRLVPLDEPTLAWHELSIEPAEGQGEVEVELGLAANASSRTTHREPEALGRAWARFLHPVACWADRDSAGLAHVTGWSGRAVVCTSTTTSTAAPEVVTAEADRIVRRFRGPARAGRPLTVLQRAAWADGPVGLGTAALRTAASAAVGRWADVDLDAALVQQRAGLAAHWDVADVELVGAEDVERAVRFATFQVLQATLANPGRAVPAKGLTGQGYEGHQLWDQEVYVGQALTLLAPGAARRPIVFRTATLPQARERARLLSHCGARFPWRTIDGTEASISLTAGIAQHHIVADVAWALDWYVTWSGDQSVLREGGYDLLVDTARFWISLGRWDDDDRFHLDGVTGPDEYTALVDDNLYTNLMAARNLRSAAARTDELGTRDRDAFARLHLDPGEADAWRRAAAAMAVPYDDQQQVHGQDADFLRHRRWAPGGHRTGDEALQDRHTLVELYRHQVLKQADAVLATVLERDRFSPAERRRVFEHYEPLTAHDSSLSRPVHAIAAFDAGAVELGWRYLCESATTDLDDRHGTLEDGLHLAAAAGAWLAVARGLGGLRLEAGRPVLEPRLPPGVERVRFAYAFEGSVYEVSCTPHRTAQRILRVPGTAAP
jgi:alpha,alpha-trehalose phosphorylase